MCVQGNSASQSPPTVTGAGYLGRIDADHGAGYLGVPPGLSGSCANSLEQRNMHLQELIHRFGVPETMLAGDDSKMMLDDWSRLTTSASLDMPFEPQEETLMALSKGSIGHPEFCARPCIYISRESCANGAECRFCHHRGHDIRASHMSKQNRLLLQAIDFSELFKIVLKLLRVRVQESDYALRDVNDILIILEQVPISLESAGDAPFLDRRDVGRLRASLRKWSIAMLVKLLLKKANQLEANGGPGVGDEFLTRLQEAANVIRYLQC